MRELLAAHGTSSQLVLHAFTIRPRGLQLFDALPLRLASRRPRLRSNLTLPPPAFCERRHRRLARRLVALSRRAAKASVHIHDRSTGAAAAFIVRPTATHAGTVGGLHFPRFRALALLGRRPSQRMEAIVIPASKKPGADGDVGRLAAFGYEPDELPGTSLV